LSALCVSSPVHPHLRPWYRDNLYACKLPRGQRQRSGHLPAITPQGKHRCQASSPNRAPPDESPQLLSTGISTEQAQGLLPQPNWEETLPQLGKGEWAVKPLAPRPAYHQKTPRDLTQSLPLCEHHSPCPCDGGRWLCGLRVPPSRPLQDRALF